MSGETFQGDPLGLQPKDAWPEFASDAQYHHFVRSIIFGGETPEQRRIRADMFGPDLLSGLMQEIATIRGKIDPLLDYTDEEYSKLMSLAVGRTKTEAMQMVQVTLKGRMKTLDELNERKLALVNNYAPEVVISKHGFNPPIQSGYMCVPTSIHTIGKHILKDRWPFDTAEGLKKSYEEKTNAKYTDADATVRFVRRLYNEGNQVVARVCNEPLTLIAGLGAGGMALAKIQSQDHVNIIEYVTRKRGEDVTFTIGDTLTGSNKERVPLREVDATFFKPNQGVSVAIIVPIPGRK